MVEKAIPTQKRSDTDPTIAFLEGAANNSKVPKPARMIAGLLGRIRRWNSDTSERTIGAASPLRARVESMAARAEERSVKMDQRLADQEQRMAERFGEPEGAGVIVPPEMHEQVPVKPLPDTPVDYPSEKIQ